MNGAGGAPRFAARAGECRVSRANLKNFLKKCGIRFILRSEGRRGPIFTAESSMEFSFFSMVAQASLVAKAVLLLLVLMSVGSWGLMIQSPCV